MVFSPWSISDCDLSIGLPVSLRSRLARRRRIFEADVSGKVKNMRTKTGPAIQSVSQRDQRQFFATTEKPERTGPRAGAQKAAATQAVSAYGSFMKEY